MLLSRITSENATIPITMPRFVAIELVISDSWPFEAAIAGNRRTDRLSTDTTSTVIIKTINLATANGLL